MSSPWEVRNRLVWDTCLDSSEDEISIQHDVHRDCKPNRISYISSDGEWDFFETLSEPAPLKHFNSSCTILSNEIEHIMSKKRKPSCMTRPRLPSVFSKPLFDLLHFSDIPTEMLLDFLNSYFYGFGLEYPCISQSQPSLWEFSCTITTHIPSLGGEYTLISGTSSGEHSQADALSSAILDLSQHLGFDKLDYASAVLNAINLPNKSEWPPEFSADIELLRELDDDACSRLSYFSHWYLKYFLCNLNLQCSVSYICIAPFLSGHCDLSGLAVLLERVPPFVPEASIDQTQHKLLLYLNDVSTMIFNLCLVSDEAVASESIIIFSKLTLHSFNTSTTRPALAAAYFVKCHQLLALELVAEIHQVAARTSNRISTSLPIGDIPICFESLQETTEPRDNISRFKCRIGRTSYSCPDLGELLSSNCILMLSTSTKVALARVMNLDRKRSKAEFVSRNDAFVLTSDIKSSWRVKVLAHLTSWEKQVAALQHVVRVSFLSDENPHSTLIAEMLLRKTISHAIPPEDNTIPGFLSKLNHSQLTAVYRALDKTEPITLLWGPPGTGKSYTAAGIVQAWLHESTSDKILITTDSNAAIDRIAQVLTSQGITRVVRIGRGKSSNSIDKIRLDHWIRLEPEYSRLLECEAEKNYSEMRRLETILCQRVVQNMDVVLSTCISSEGKFTKNIVFQRIIIDEGAQASEVSTIVPIVKGCTKLVIIGDHMQLPCTLLSRRAEELGLGISMFERLILLVDTDTVVLLRKQYRMHPSLAIWPSSAFYNDRLVSGITSKERPVPNGFPWPNIHHPIALVDVVGGFEQNCGLSKFNVEEVEFAVQCVEMILSTGELNPTDIGIITPYQEQASRIRCKVTSGVNVNTVDGFQGSEKELIVISLVRSNANGDIGFVHDLKRLNVALTRGKRGVIVLGNMSTFISSGSPYWTSWMDWVQSNSLVIS